MASHMVQNAMHFLQELSLSVALTLFASLEAYAIIKVVYNLFFHPLRSYPGPLLARSTVLVAQWQALRGHSHVWPHELHHKYGPVVRTKPNELSFIDPQGWKDVFGHKPSNGIGPFAKNPSFYGPDIFGEPPGLIRADNVGHARQRKLVSHAFSERALREQEELIRGYVVLLVKKLKETATSVGKGRVNIVDWYNFTTFDIMADLTFGEPLNLLEGSNYTPWVRSLFGGIKAILFTQVLRVWPMLDFCLRALLPQSVKEMQKRHMRHTIDRVEKRMARKTDRPDIWTHLMRHSESDENKGKGLTTTEMHSNAGLFMLAGTETTATELSGLTYLLLKSPERMERLKNEVRSAFATPDEMTMVGLSQLRYLNACLEEGMRMFPPVPIGAERKVPQGGAKVCGNWLPGGTIVILPHFAAYHSPANFKKPDEFIPERWLPEGEEEFSDDKKDTLQPFSHGPRNCLGKNLAYHEMRLVLANILWNFDMELCDPSMNWLDMKVWILWDKKPLMVKLTPVRA
ncbi:cytochrome P450 [Clohesyomyces aquaticus]|uniref:Cytochrome P450 n=1 Tax=Clohesyomyces aquaticus TaxID=1231657 RepID=A0A1Y2A0C0_9PLEO|nr:cytochrome P450 [Clohesyomyces aquaticus]